ncbi:MAG: hypothetical protein HY840_02395 [Bacteroidetes bacterium]|nr:hypothetical protein [Bacteroidota bacterium]
MQDFFAHNAPDTEIDLLRNVANIPNLIFNSPHDIAITQLLKMEKDLAEYDIPHALTTVYSALKKLHRYSKKYYDYSQKYNKHLAYTIALDKVKELLFDFNKTLGEYLMSRDVIMLELLAMLKQEMHNHAQLYESHHLTVYRNILDIKFALFVPLQTATEEDPPVDEMLEKTAEIIRSYPKDLLYKNLSHVINFLWFQYYHRHKLHKKGSDHFDSVNANLHLLLLHNFCCYPSAFLLSKIERALNKNEQEKLYEESKALAALFTPDPADVPNYINYVKFNAATAFYSKKYNESIALLNDLLNTISFRNFPHAEIEVKLFLALCYLLASKFELADNLIKNVQRKLRDMRSNESLKNQNNYSYENAQVFAKILAMQMDSAEKCADKKTLFLRDKFLSLNQGNTQMLEFIRMDDALIKKLSKAMK